MSSLRDQTQRDWKLQLKVSSSHLHSAEAAGCRAPRRVFKCSGSLRGAHAGLPVKQPGLLLWNATGGTCFELMEGQRLTGAS